MDLKLELLNVHAAAAVIPRVTSMTWRASVHGVKPSLLVQVADDAHVLEIAAQLEAAVLRVYHQTDDGLKDWLYVSTMINEITVEVMGPHRKTQQAAA